MDSNGLPLAEFCFPGAAARPPRGGEPRRRDGVDHRAPRECGLLEEYRREGKPVEEIGERAPVDSAGQAVAVIETIEVEVERMADVDLAVAIAEGKGFATVGVAARIRAVFTSSS